MFIFVVFGVLIKFVVSSVVADELGLLVLIQGPLKHNRHHHSCYNLPQTLLPPNGVSCNNGGR